MMTSVTFNGGYGLRQCGMHGASYPSIKVSTGASAMNRAHSQKSFKIEAKPLIVLIRVIVLAF